MNYGFRQRINPFIINFIEIKVFESSSPLLSLLDAFFFDFVFFLVFVLSFSVREAVVTEPDSLPISDVFYYI